MREENIERMNFKELRSEVQLLRDELAVFKRKYEDAIMNLDSDNFGKSFTVEQSNMKSQIKIAADAIKTMVSDTDLQSALANYSTITQTADAIKTEVSALENDIATNYSTITQTADAISSVVSSKANLKDAIIIADLSQAIDTSEIYKIQTYNSDGKVIGENYYYYNDLSGDWGLLSGDSIYTVFNQTASGFELKGNVVIDGSTVITKNITADSLSTKISEVADTLYIGDSDNALGKSIIFANEAKISTVSDFVGVGLSISASAIKIGGGYTYLSGTLDLEECTNIKWGNNKPTASGVAVFG